MDQRPTITITLEHKGEVIEHNQQPIDIFAQHPPFAAVFYEAIGKVVLQSGYLENQLSAVLDMCRKIETEQPVRDGKIVAYSRKIEAVRDALKHGRLWGEPSDDPMWSAILAAARTVDAERNSIVHGVVAGFEEGPPSRIRLSKDDPKAQPKETTYTISELENVISRMQEVHLLLGALNFVLGTDYVIRASRGVSA